MGLKITQEHSASRRKKHQRELRVAENNGLKCLAILAALAFIELPGFIALESPFLVDFALASAAIYVIHYKINLNHMLSAIIISLCTLTCFAHLFAFSVSFFSSDTILMIDALTHNALQEKYHYLLWVILLLKVMTMAWGGRGIWQQHKRDIDRADRGVHHAGVIVVRAKDSNTGSEAANC